MSAPEDHSVPRGEGDGNKHWLYRRANRPKLWLAQIAILVAAVLPEFFIHRHLNFEDEGFLLDGAFAFYAWYGFVACAGMVAVAKVLGIFLKRRDTYYDE